MNTAGLVHLRTDVDDTNIDDFIERHAIAVVLIHAPDNPGATGLKALSGVCADMSLPTALAAIDATRTPAVLAHFGVERAPHLLVMRARIALYSERVLPSAQGLRALLDQVGMLDMDKVRAEIADEQRAREALQIRRACPTLRSGPATTRKS